MSKSYNMKGHHNTGLDKIRNAVITVINNLSLPGFADLYEAQRRYEINKRYE